MFNTGSRVLITSQGDGHLVTLEALLLKELTHVHTNLTLNHVTLTSS